MRSTWLAVRTFNRSTVLWLLVWAVIGFAFFGIQGVLFNLFLLRLGLAPQTIGLLIGAGQLTWAVCALPAGSLGRRIGLRGAQIAGLGLLAVANVPVLVVEALPPPLWTGWLVGWYMLTWAGAALVTVNSPPYAMSVAGAAARNAAFSLQQAVVALAALAGSLAAGALPGLLVGWMGGSLAEPAPYRAVLWLAPLGYLGAMLALVGAQPARLALGDGEAAASGRPLGLFVLVGLLAVLAATAEGAVRAFFNVYLDRGLGASPAQIGAIMGLGQLSPIVMSLATPLVLGRWGAARTIGFSGLALALALLPLAAVPRWDAAALGFMGVMAAAAMNIIARSLFSQECVAPQWQTTTSALATIGGALGWASTAAVGGFVIAATGFGGLFLLSAVVAAAGALLALGYWWRAVRSGTQRTPAPGAI